MRGGIKVPPATIAALLIAVGFTACGGGSSSSGSTDTEAARTHAEGSFGDAGPEQSEATTGEGKEGGSESPARKSEAANFTPKPHRDSGGGSQQFIQKGGDNSVQEFGEEAEPQEFDAAAVALHNFLDARAEGNWAAACDYMAMPVIESFQKLAAQAKQIEDRSCAGILEKLTNPAAKGALKAEAEKADVGSLRVEGDRSFVIYTGTEGTVLAMPMANEGGHWKVAGLAGTPLN